MSEHVFKEGDIVKVKSSCSSSNPGVEYKLKYGRQNAPGNKDLFADVGNGHDGCSCKDNWILIKGGNTMKKTIWNIIVIDKTTDEIKVNEIVIDGDEKSACSKVSITFADKLKNLVFDNLAYVTKELGSYDKEDKNAKK